jgi:hypothetical protein
MNMVVDTQTTAVVVGGIDIDRVVVVAAVHHVAVVVGKQGAVLTEADGIVVGIAAVAVDKWGIVVGVVVLVAAAAAAAVVAVGGGVRGIVVDDMIATCGVVGVAVDRRSAEVAAVQKKIHVTLCAAAAVAVAGVCVHVLMMWTMAGLGRRCSIACQRGVGISPILSSIRPTNATRRISQMPLAPKSHNHITHHNTYTHHTQTTHTNKHM